MPVMANTVSLAIALALIADGGGGRRVARRDSPQAWTPPEGKSGLLARSKTLPRLLHSNYRWELSLCAQSHHQTSMAPPASKPLHCSLCAKQFGRTEHLKRHELIHTSGKNFVCNDCGKGFQRRLELQSLLKPSADWHRDALNRHELTHQLAAPSLLSRGVRACNACAVAKTRCSGGSPCSRCQQRDVECVHPETMTEAPALENDLLPPSNAMQSGVLIDSNVDFQSRLYPSPDIPLPLGSSTAAFDPDFWDPTILSTTNWLDSVIEGDFQGLEFGFDVSPGGLSTGNIPVQINNQISPWQPTRQAGNTVPPISAQSPAIGSSVSVNSGLSSAETAAEICAAQESEAHTVGEYYVDGEPARLPRTKRRKLSSNQHVERSQASQGSAFSLHLTPFSETDLAQRVHLPLPIYERFFAMYQSTCVAPQPLWPTFEVTEFLAKEIFEHLIGLYFAQFHQTLPLLHPPSFNVLEVHPLLLLAMTSIGAHFLPEDNSRIATSLAEIVRRNLWATSEILSTEPMDTVTLAKIRLLLSIVSLYSGDAKMISRGLEMRQSLLSMANELGKAGRDFREAPSSTNEANWATWIRREQISRVFYTIWLLDCMWAYQFQMSPLLALKDATLPLPCHEKHWRASSFEEWDNLASARSPTPSLKDALQELYIDKRLPRDRGEFARIIMVHGLCQRTWEVERYYSDPLSQWEPTAKKQTSKDILPSEPVPLLSVPTYTKWQNSVCDCIDILHWQANATIGQASGLEHPTVGFLHLSRVVLLSPIDVIVRYAMTSIGMHNSNVSDLNIDKKTILRWATQGQYKARLAAIHAGVVFWHIRRYSIDAFYEAPAVALAALMLWAFGKFSPRQTSQRQSRSGDDRAMTGQNDNGNESQNEASDDSACGIILLDRPTDDELVQQFIRRGHTMRAHITGVGDLYGRQGPQRVLAEGCKLLQSLKCWGVADRWLDILQQLHQRYSDG